MSPSPVDDAAFAAAIDRLGPYERVPRLAVAVSGGSDSMALALLAGRWARGRGGSVIGLTVDHRLRPEAAAEAVQVGRWLAGHGISHEILVWSDPVADQAAARDARYALLDAACARRGILHLLVGHTRDDQAETVLLRLAKGSGVDGLAGISAVRERFGARLLRPMLGFSRADLRATLDTAGQPWIDDPSNDSPRYARGRLRSAAARLAAEGLDDRALARTAHRAGRARAALEAVAAELAARAALIAPEGWIALDPAPLLRAPLDVALRVLARCLMVVGGDAHPPGAEQLERLFAALRDGGLGGGRTLAGCRIVAGRAGRFAIVREPARATARLPLRAEVLWWDRRFRVAPPDRVAGLPEPLEFRALGTSGARRVPGTGLPSAVVRTLPGLWSGDRLCAVPGLLAVRGGLDGLGTFEVSFSPVEPLAGPTFAVV